MGPLYILVAIAVVPASIACFIKNKVIKGILCAISSLAFLLNAFFYASFMLSSYIGVHGSWLSFVLFGAVYAIFMLFAWKPFKPKTRRIAVISIAGVAVILAAVFIMPEVYRSSIPVSREEVNLMLYTPFGNYWYVDGVLTHHESLVVTLNEESSLQLNGELPRIDGATALYPLYSAFVRATYPVPEPQLDLPAYSPYNDFREENSEFKPLIACSRTAAAFENLIDGYADIVFLMGVSDEQRAIADAKGLDLVLTPIGGEAFVFFVNRRNSISNLSSDDIRRIYSGEVTNWKDVGGANNAIKAYQRSDESGSQTMLKQIMGDVTLVPAPLNEIFSTMMGIYERVADYKNYKNSLGYSFLYYIRDMIGENIVKFLSIDGITPSSENIANGSYPFTNSIYAVTVRQRGELLNPDRAENIIELLEWILSPQGQYLVEATGYVPLSND